MISNALSLSILETFACLVFEFCLDFAMRNYIRYKVATRVFVVHLKHFI